jgi:hypothetical protein
MSNKGLNSNDALEESTVTNASVMLSGIRRLKEAPGALDIQDYRTDPGNSDERGLEIASNSMFRRFDSIRQYRHAEFAAS